MNCNHFSLARNIGNRIHVGSNSVLLFILLPYSPPSISFLPYSFLHSSSLPLVFYICPPPSFIVAWFPSFNFTMAQFSVNFTMAQYHLPSVHICHSPSCFPLPAISQLPPYQFLYSSPIHCLISISALSLFLPIGTV